MEFDLPADLAMLRDTVRRFVDEQLIPIELSPDPADTGDERFAMLQDQLRSMGLWHLDVPEDLGGAGLGLLGTCVVEEEIGRTKAFAHRSHELMGPPVPPVLLEATAEQRARILQPVLDGRLVLGQVVPEADPTAGTGGPAFSAEDDEDGHVVTGAHTFVATTRAPDRLLLVARSGAAGVTCLLVDAASPGVELLAAGRTIGGQPLWSLRLDHVAVPATDRLGPAGGCGDAARRWLAATRIRRHGARSVGIASRALDMAASYARSRITFGKPLAARHAIRAMLADSMTEIRTTRLLVHEAAHRFDRGEDVGDLSAMVKIAGTETATRVIDRSMQIHGGVGLTLEFPLEHWFREIRAARIVDGVNEDLRDGLAGRLVGDLSTAVATGSTVRAASS